MREVREEKEFSKQRTINRSEGGREAPPNFPQINAHITNMEVGSAEKQHQQQQPSCVPQQLPQSSSPSTPIPTMAADRCSGNSSSTAKKVLDGTECRVFEVVNKGASIYWARSLRSMQCHYAPLIFDVASDSHVRDTSQQCTAQTNLLPYCGKHLNSEFGVEVRQSGIEGYGVFATRLIRKDTYVCPPYIGEVIDHEERDKRYGTQTSALAPYALEFQNNYSFDAAVARCAAAYINAARGSGANPNVRFTNPQFVAGQPYPFVRVIANVNIQPGQEITVGYGSKYWVKNPATQFTTRFVDDPSILTHTASAIIYSNQKTSSIKENTIINGNVSNTLSSSQRKRMKRLQHRPETPTPLHNK